MKKRTCNGCRALDFNCNCELGFGVYKELSNGFAISAKPFEECPKPKTIKELIYYCSKKALKRKRK